MRYLWGFVSDKQEKDDHLWLHCVRGRQLYGSRYELLDHVKEIHQIEASAVFWPPDRVKANLADVDDEWSEGEVEAMDHGLFDPELNG